jgi:predicted RNase H-like HicB family nuclease
VKTERKFTVVIERDENGYYVATVPGLSGCHTQAKTLDTLMKRTREVIELCLENNGRDAAPLELVGIQQISLCAASLGSRVGRLFGHLKGLGFEPPESAAVMFF